MANNVVFQTNIPVEVAFEGDGKDVNDQYGDQVLYTLIDGRVMYVPPIVRKQIDDCVSAGASCSRSSKPRGRTVRAGRLNGK
jgi:hypothetical protein